MDEFSAEFARAAKKGKALTGVPKYIAVLKFAAFRAKNHTEILGRNP
jgi:hypothetical protein